MIAKDQAHHFAQEWMEAWNAHNVERVLSHYTEDFEMSSTQRFGEFEGGKRWLLFTARSARRARRAWAKTLLDTTTPDKAPAREE